MQCPECQHENPEGSRFCNGCGAKLEIPCSACNHVNPAGSRFCNACGHDLATAPSPDQNETQPAAEADRSSIAPSVPEAERRQLTVMFCDLVGSTSLSGELDPEDLRDVVRDYQAMCTSVIQYYEGHVAQHLGDGLLVYFSYPRAHEDDAQRAVQTGLGILESLRTHNARLEANRSIHLSVRIGIHTGLVVVGEIGSGGRQEQLALGETPNVAARIQGIAEPDRVVISGDTYRLVQGYFDCESLGEHELRGVAQPFAVYDVQGASGIQSRFDVASTRGLTPLVGRESEVTLLLDRWQQAANGSGQVVLLSGEAGIGKSRLVQVLKEHVATVSHIQLECRNSPYYQNTALYPISDLMQRTLQWKPDDNVGIRLRKLEQALGRYQLALEESVPLLSTLLSLPLPQDRYPPLHLTPQRQRQRVLETLVTLFVEESERQPVLFIVEDLHWTDPTTLELLELLIDQSATAPIFTLLTCRPEFEPPWSRRSFLTEVALSRLSKRQMSRLVERVANDKRLPDEVLRELVDKTDGVPLYLEEMTKAVIEAGVLKEHDDHYELVGAVASLAIPATLHDSLMARLDRLESAKGVAQLGAVIGRQFSYELLSTVSELDEATLQRELRRLVEAELVYQRGVLPGATYLFKHALIQDTAYESLLRRTRQQYHRRIIDGIIERFPETAETQPELLAHHFTEAGLNDQAVDHWQKAGQQAVEGLSYEEAIQHLKRALEMLPTLPENPGRNQLELGMLLALERALRAVTGLGSEEVESILTRARELCQQAEDSLELFGVLRALAAFHNYRANFQTALELLEQSRLLAQRLQDPACLQLVHERRGVVWWVQGELRRARNDFEQAISLHDLHGSHVHLMTRMDPGMRCRSSTYLAVCLGIMGFPDQALMRVREGLALAQKMSHPHQLCNSLSWTAMFYVHRREPREAQSYAEICISLATEQGLPQWLSEATVALGAALVMQGQGEMGIEQMRQGQDAIEAIGNRILVPQHLTLRAEAHLNLGQSEAGLILVGEALGLVDETGMKYDTSTLHRLKGELLLQRSSDHTVEAETCFHQAIAIAQNQSAKSWELRAANSLARLWQSQNKRQDAYDLLAPVYNWFTEGLDTVDIQEAKALLVELGA